MRRIRMLTYFTVINVNIINKTKLRYIQLHGKEDDKYILNLKKEFNLNIIKRLGVNNINDFKKMEKLSHSDYFLFDYKPRGNELPGGNAKKFDWSMLRKIKINKPFFLSGGININNIGEIKNNLIPYGIDISSGVEEKPGIKSKTKIIEILKKIND